MTLKYNIYREKAGGINRVWRKNLTKLDVEIWMQNIADHKTGDGHATAGAIGSDSFSASVYHDAEQILTVYTAKVVI